MLGDLTFKSKLKYSLSGAYPFTSGQPIPLTLTPPPELITHNLLDVIYLRVLTLPTLEFLLHPDFIFLHFISSAPNSV